MEDGGSSINIFFHKHILLILCGNSSSQEMDGSNLCSQFRTHYKSKGLLTTQRKESMPTILFTRHYEMLEERHLNQIRGISSDLGEYLPTLRFS